jgi:hypothetical protein
MHWWESHANKENVGVSKSFSPNYTFKFAVLQQEVSAREHDSHTCMIYLSNSESFEELMRVSGVITEKEPADSSKSVTKMTIHVSFRGCLSSNTRVFIDFKL